MPRPENPISYASSGVNYDDLDPFKRTAQLQAGETSKNILRRGFRVVEESRGESAQVIDEGDRYSAHVIEGLGTKNLVADQVRLHRLGNQSEIAGMVMNYSGRTHYDALAQDTVAMIMNDLITVGADPINLQAYCAVGDSSWFRDEQRSMDLANGFRVAADLSGANWGGGETPSLSGIIYPTAIDLGGSAYGIIDPKSRIAIADEKSGLQSKLKEGDAIVIVESSGIHANGLSLARRIASNIAEQKGSGLPDAYTTKLLDGTTFGESLLTPTHIYAGLTRDMFDAGIDIHYMVNVTGHGWRKFMRSPEELSYVIDRVPDPQPIFPFIQEHSQSSEKDMYGNFNMGAGFVYFVPEHQVSMIREIASSHHYLKADGVGYVEKGPKRVVIRPKNIEFQGSSLAVR